MFVRIRTLVIGKFFSPSTLAYYERGDSFPGLIMNNVCGSVQAVIFPALSEVQHDRPRVRAMMRRAINTSCLFMFPTMVGLMIAAKPLVLLLLTDKWLPAVPYMQILCIANFFRPITIPNQQAITALGYSDITLRLELIKKIVDITILAISCYLGVLAIAWGVVAFNFICVFINLTPNIRLLNYKLHEQVLDVLPTLLISILMGVTIIWIPLTEWSPIIQLVLIFIIGSFVFATSCRLFKIECFMYLYNRIAPRLFKLKK